MLHQVLFMGIITYTHLMKNRNYKTSINLRYNKIASENIAYYYKQIFNINSYGLRFFTVYGPFSRPDMSIFIFFKNILLNKTIYLNNFLEKI